MIELTAQDSWVFWQRDDETGVGEEAILIEKYSDTISLTCNGHSINLNYDSLNELLKLLRRIKKEHDSK
jgi:hypothetical protein